VKHRFTIFKRMHASLPQVIANYLDLEHIPVHSGLRACEVLSETEDTACFVLTSQVGPFAVRNVHHFEFHPPCEILNIVKTPLGPMRVVSTASVADEPDGVCTEVLVDVEIDLPALVYPFRRLVERLLRHLNEVVLEEDMTVLSRRQELFGDFIEDFLRPRQVILFKELFRAHYSQADSADQEMRRSASIPARSGRS
jgi:hypothetical protein